MSFFFLAFETLPHPLIYVDVWMWIYSFSNAQKPSLSLFVHKRSISKQSQRKGVTNFHTVKGSLEQQSVNDTSESFGGFSLPRCYAWWIQCIFSLPKRDVGKPGTIYHLYTMTKWWHGLTAQLRLLVHAELCVSSCCTKAHETQWITQTYFPKF